MPKVLFLSKRSPWCSQAEAFAREVFKKDILVLCGEVKEALPKEIIQWSGDIILSFLSPWIVPGELLERARVQSINFHPGPPEYPGIGCYNFALYDGVDEYGVTAHEMAPKVDTGRIIAVSSFAVDPAETVWSLKEKSMKYMLDLFKSVVKQSVEGKVYPGQERSWTRRPYTRQELNDLCRLELSMSSQEIARRVRATSFPGAPGAWLELNGYHFVLDSENQMKGR